MLFIIIFIFVLFKRKSHDYWNKYLEPVTIQNVPIKKDRIFVSIASYRDPECEHTVESLLENAKNPENIKVVVLQQNHPLDPFGLVSHGNVQAITLPHTEAMGPVWARYLLQKQWNGEEYFLQIDSHTQFEPNWDQLLVDMLPGPKTVITQYLPEYDHKTKSKTRRTRSHLYVKGFGADGFTRIQSDYTSGASGDKVESYAWAACFSFSKYDILGDAPYDPYLPYLFFGEEMDVTLRLYTRGWKFYSPNIPLAYTTFYRGYRKTIWSDRNHNKRLEKLSRKRLHNRYDLPNKGSDLLDTHSNIYCLGKTKSLRDYEDFAKIGLKMGIVYR